MKIVGLLCWFDEDPAWLAEAVGSALGLCDEVVALDGAYEGFPGARIRSGAEQEEAIRAAGGLPVGTRRLWPNQVTKRTALFRLGLARDADWFLVFDADDLVTHVPGDARSRLEQAVEDVAVYTFGGDRYHRGLFRALPGIRVEDAHYHFVAEKNDRTVHLKGDQRYHDLVPFLNLTDLRVAHRKPARTPERQRASAEYRRLVAAQAIEPTTPDQWAAVA